jgi:hypothetical protein
MMDVTTDVGLAQEVPRYAQSYGADHMGPNRNSRDGIAIAILDRIGIARGTGEKKIPFVQAEGIDLEIDVDHEIGMLGEIIVDEAGKGI